MNKLFISNEAISIAVRDFLKLITVLGVKLALTNVILYTICQMLNQTISNVLHEILYQIIFILLTREYIFKASMLTLKIPWDFVTDALG